MSLRDVILSRVESLPTLSTTVARLFTLLNDDRSSASDFERVIKPDPALTANLLRIVNSAYFSTPRKVASTRQAITFLGTKRVFEVATGAGFAQILPQQLPGYEVEAPAFWLHSVAVAILSDLQSTAERLCLRTTFPFWLG